MKSKRNRLSPALLTIADCPALAEIAVGGALGAAILFAAHLVSKHTPLGEYAGTAADAMGRVVYEGGATLTRRRYLMCSKLPL